jgi:hypothetical protein
MCVDRRDEFEERDQAEFERRLRGAMQHRDAPVGLKQRVLGRARERRLARHGRLWMWQRIAMACVLIVVVGGVAGYREHERRVEEQERGAVARAQVMLALRITQKTLDRVGERLNGR